MATTTTKKATTRKTTAKKTTKADVVDEIMTENVEQKNDETEALKEQNAQLLEMITQLQTQMMALQNNTTPNVQYVEKVSSSGKNIKLISLMNIPINVSTESDGSGITKTFDRYGDSRTVKFDVLSDMVASYPNTFQRGLIYIADEEAVDELGLTDEYKKICSKEILDRISNLVDDDAVDLFCEIDDILKDSIATDIARKIVEGKKYDLNKIRDIKDRTGFDIESIADTIEEEKRILKEKE